MDPNNQKVYPPLDGQAGMPQPQSGMPQPGFYPPQQPPQYDVGQTTVITQQPTTTVFIQSPQYGPDPQSTQCPSCRAAITTSVKYEASTKTHLIAALICVCGCWAGCCLIPYCVDSCQSANHSCPNCGQFLGTHS